MQLNILPFTVKLCAIIRTLLPADKNELDMLILSISPALCRHPDETLMLVARARQPYFTSGFTGENSFDDWYDNNIQMPRLLVALSDYLKIYGQKSNYVNLSQHESDLIEQSRFFLSAYSKRKQLAQAA